MKALETLLSTINIKRLDEVIPNRGICLDPSTGFTHIRYRREGVEGEFCIQVKCELIKPFVNPNWEKS